VQVPENWSELTVQQFSTVVTVLYFRKADPFVVRTSLLTALFDAKNWHVLQHLPDEFIYELLPLTDWIFTLHPPAENRFPEIRVPDRLIAPADDLSNLTFGEWCFAHQLLQHYVRTWDDQWLDRLIAVLYRSNDTGRSPKDPDWNGD